MRQKKKENFIYPQVRKIGGLTDFGGLPYSGAP